MRIRANEKRGALKFEHQGDRGGGGEGHTEDERSPRTTAINAQSRLRASSVINNHGDVKGVKKGGCQR